LVRVQRLRDWRLCDCGPDCPRCSLQHRREACSAGRIRITAQGTGLDLAKGLRRLVTFELQGQPGLPAFLALGACRHLAADSGPDWRIACLQFCSGQHERVALLAMGSQRGMLTCLLACVLAATLCVGCGVRSCVNATICTRNCEAQLRIKIRRDLSNVSCWGRGRMGLMGGGGAWGEFEPGKGAEWFLLFSMRFI